MSFVTDPIYARTYQGSLMEISSMSGNLNYFIFEATRLAYADKLVEYYSSEERLTAGRFHNFFCSVSDNPIDFTFDGHRSSEVFQRVLEWVAAEAKGRWSFHLRCDFSVLKKRSPLVILTMFFEDATDSLLYRLHLP